eukprot:g43092.t1
MNFFVSGRRLHQLCLFALLFTPFLGLAAGEGRPIRSIEDVHIGSIDEQAHLVRLAMQHNQSLVPAAYLLLRESILRQAATSISLSNAISLLTHLPKHKLGPSKKLTWKTLVGASTEQKNFDRADDWRYAQNLVQRALPEVVEDVDQVMATYSDNPLFDELCASYLNCPSDKQAILLAEKENKEIASRMLNQADPVVGHAVPELRKHGEKWSRNTCRHTLSLTLLFHAMTRAGLTDKLVHGELRFVEIGGGYGNMVRLVQNAYGFEAFAGIDLPFVTLLQDYYLDYTLPDHIHLVLFKEDMNKEDDSALCKAQTNNRNIAQRFGKRFYLDEDDPEFMPETSKDCQQRGHGAPKPGQDFSPTSAGKPGKNGEKNFSPECAVPGENGENSYAIQGEETEAHVTLVSTQHFQEFAYDFDGADVLIASRSWSTLLLDDWFSYYNAFIGRKPKVEWILYIYDVKGEDHTRQLDILFHHFEILRQVTHEGACHLVLRLKNPKLVEVFVELSILVLITWKEAVEAYEFQPALCGGKDFENFQDGSHAFFFPPTKNLILMINVGGGFQI